MLILGVFAELAGKISSLHKLRKSAESASHHLTCSNYVLASFELRHPRYLRIIQANFIYKIEYRV